MSFRDLIEAFDFRDYLDKFGSIRKSGATNVVLSTCPLCGDNRWKFYANTSNGPGNGAWQSHCCHDQGGLVGFIEKVEEISRPEACSFIRSKVEGEDEKLVPLVAAMPAEALPALAEASVEATANIPMPIHELSPRTPCMMQGSIHTIEERGVSQYIIDRHHLRLLGDGTCYGSERRQDLDNRLLVPVYGPDGDLLSWQARDLFGVHRRKYVFPAGDRSSETFYGWPDAKDQKTVLIVEGVFAKWAWDSLGREIGNPSIERLAVASFGKKMSAAQEELLMSSPVKRVILGWDLDAAAQIAKIALRLNGRKEILIMPAHSSGRDHDELSSQEMMELLTSAVPVTMEVLIRLNAGAKLL